MLSDIEMIWGGKLKIAIFKGGYVMTGIFCSICGGNIEELMSGEGAVCDTCGFRIRSDGSYDYSEVETEEENCINKNFKEDYDQKR